MKLTAGHDFSLIASFLIGTLFQIGLWAPHLLENSNQVLLLCLESGSSALQHNAYRMSQSKYRDQPITSQLYHAILVCTNLLHMVLTRSWVQSHGNSYLNTWQYFQGNLKSRRTLPTSKPSPYSDQMRLARLWTNRLPPISFLHLLKVWWGSLPGEWTRWVHTWQHLPNPSVT